LTAGSFKLVMSGPCFYLVEGRVVTERTGRRRHKKTPLLTFLILQQFLTPTAVLLLSGTESLAVRDVSRRSHFSRKHGPVCHFRKFLGKSLKNQRKSVCDLVFLC